MKNVHFTAIDFETAQSGRAACQLGIVVVRQGEIVEQKKFLIQPPQNEYSIHCTNVHGLTAKDTKDAPTFDKIWDEVKPYLEKQTVVCHNSSYDINVLQNDCTHYHITPCKLLSVVCTSTLHDHASLEDVCASYNISLDNHHDALADANACAQIFLNYLTTEGDVFVKRTPSNRSSTRNTTTWGDDLASLIAHGTVPKKYLTKKIDCADKTSPFYDKKVVITGIFPIERDELSKIVYEMGADINTSISSKTDIVLVGESAGPKKLEKVQLLNQKGNSIVVYNVYEVMELINKYL